MLLLCIAGVLLLTGLAGLQLQSWLHLRLPPFPKVEDGEAGRTLEGLPAAYLTPLRALHQHRERLDHPLLLAPVRRLRAQAEQALTLKPFAVTHKTDRAASGNPRDYYDLSPYFWPNPWTPTGLPWIYRDGHVNPAAKDETCDRSRLFALVEALQTLSLVYYLTAEERYAEHAALLLRTWFLDPDHGMNPHLRYAQAIPGLLEGSSLGLCRAKELVQLLDASRLIQSSSAWTRDDVRGLRDWFTHYVRWLRETPGRQLEQRMRNNHGTWFDLTLAALAAEIGHVPLLDTLLEHAPERHASSAIDAAGRQPMELGRSRSFYYSVFNLEGLLHFERLARSQQHTLKPQTDPDNQPPPWHRAARFLIEAAEGRQPWEHRRLPEKDDWRLGYALMLANLAELEPDLAHPAIQHVRPALPSDHPVHLLLPLP